MSTPESSIQASCPCGLVLGCLIQSNFPRVGDPKNNCSPMEITRNSRLQEVIPGVTIPQGVTLEKSQQRRVSHIEGRVLARCTYLFHNAEETSCGMWLGDPTHLPARLPEVFAVSFLLSVQVPLWVLQTPLCAIGAGDNDVWDDDNGPVTLHLCS